MLERALDNRAIFLLDPERSLGHLGVDAWFGGLFRKAGKNAKEPENRHQGNLPEPLSIHNFPPEKNLHLADRFL
jgi:hypothetical protein